MRQTRHIKRERHIIPGLDTRRDVAPVFAMDDVEGAVRDELVPASDAHRELDARLALWCVQVEAHAIVVDELDVD